jgi:hypothetical protein
VRRAAGSSIRDVLQFISQEWKVSYYETEGIALYKDFVEKKSVLSVITIREPIDRIISSYWYDHVGWYDGLLKQTEKCKTLQEWIYLWEDKSLWKKKFLKENPNTLYIEIQNYYIKMLIGWNGAKEIDENDFEEAIAIIEKFDVVFVAEWMADITQLDAINSLFPGRLNIAVPSRSSSSYHAKQRLQEKLIPNEVFFFFFNFFFPIYLLHIFFLQKQFKLLKIISFCLLTAAINK